MLDEESPDNNHTRFRQTLVINAIFISRTFEAIPKNTQDNCDMYDNFAPAFWTNKLAWTNIFF